MIAEEKLREPAGIDYIEIVEKRHGDPKARLPAAESCAVPFGERAQAFHDWSVQFGSCYIRRLPRGLMNDYHDY